MLLIWTQKQVGFIHQVLSVAIPRSYAYNVFLVLGPLFCQFCMTHKIWVMDFQHLLIPPVVLLNYNVIRCYITSVTKLNHNHVMVHIHPLLWLKYYTLISATHELHSWTHRQITSTSYCFTPVTKFMVDVPKQIFHVIYHSIDTIMSIYYRFLQAHVFYNKKLHHPVNTQCSLKRGNYVNKVFWICHTCKPNST